MKKWIFCIATMLALCTKVGTAALLVAVMLTGNAFGDLYTCVDGEGNKRIQSNPCGSNEKTIDRQVSTVSSRQTAGKGIEQQLERSRKTMEAAHAFGTKAVAEGGYIGQSAANAYNGAMGAYISVAGCMAPPEVADKTAALERARMTMEAAHAFGLRAVAQSGSLIGGRSAQSVYNGAIEAYVRTAGCMVPSHPANKAAPVYSSPAPQVFSPPASPRSAINTQTGEVYPGVAGGVINPRNGQFYPDVGGGYINPRTGQFMPKQ